MRSSWGRLVPGAVILLYHRIAELQVDPWDLAVTPAHFAAHLRVLRRRAAVIPLHDLIERLTSGSVPRRSVVVTFDDGYADNLLVAKPALEHEDLPATVFITTGPLEADAEFWWDELEAILLTPGSLPHVLELEIGQQPHRWTLDGWADYTEHHARQYARWRPWKSPPTSRHLAFLELWRMLRLVDDAERRTVLVGLAQWAGRTERVRPSHRTLRAEEVRALASGPCVSVGAHSVTHPRLSSLPESDQRKELAESRQRLEQILGRPVTTLAYPFGGPSDYTPATRGLARDTGFSCACAGRAGTVRRSSDLYSLPRCHVPNVGGREFEEMLERWFHLA